MSDDIQARIVEAAARAICRAPDPQAEECPCKMNHAMSVYRCCKGPVRDARAAIAAAVRESGVDLQRVANRDVEHRLAPGLRAGLAGCHQPLLSPQGSRPRARTSSWYAQSPACGSSSQSTR